MRHFARYFLAQQLICSVHVVFGYMPLKTPPAQARGVLGGASTLPPFPSWRGKAALVSLRSDFRADALRHGGYPCFGAAPAPLSRVLSLARVLPSGAPPHLPRGRQTGHTRGCNLLQDQDRPPETPNTGRAAPAQCHTGTGEAAARAAWRRTSRIRDSIGTVS